MSSQIKSRLTWPPEAKEDQIQELPRQQFPPTSRHDQRIGLLSLGPVELDHNIEVLQFGL